MTRTRLAVFVIAASAAAGISTVLGLVGHELHLPVAVPVLELAIGALVFARVFGLVSQSDRYLAKLDEAETRYRTLVEQIPAVVYMDEFDDASTNIYVSPQIVNLLGYTPEQWRSEPGKWITLIHPEDRERVLIEHARSNADADVFSAEFRVFARDGREVWIRDDARLVNSSDGKSKYWQGVMFDVTAEHEAAVEREALEAHLRQAQKMEAVGQLAGGIAHDVNNLLAVIQNYARFVYDELPKSDEKRGDLGEVMKAGERGAGLIRQLLTFSRKEIVEPEILDLNESIGEMTPLIRRVVPESVELRTNLDPNLDRIEADRGQIDQVLMNLAMNAGDAMPGSGILEIGSSNRTVEHATEELPAGDYVCLTIADNGTGMDEEVLNRAFEPFFTTKGRGSGTGLGLATVYGIVRRSGGSIDIQSEIGRGTTFRIHLPAVRLRSEPSPSARVTAKTILVTEDEEAIRKMVGRLLERAGHTVLMAETPAEALDFARAQRPIDLLLTDVVMPEMSGKQLADLLADSRPGLPTLFMSGYPEDILAGHHVAADVDDYIQKPFTGESLLAKIHQILDRSAREAIEVGR
jgi:PAS domain S-box-containing protein